MYRKDKHFTVDGMTEIIIQIDSSELRHCVAIYGLLFSGYSFVIMQRMSNGSSGLCILPQKIEACGKEISVGMLFTYMVCNLVILSIILQNMFNMTNSKSLQSPVSENTDTLMFGTYA